MKTGTHYHCSIAARLAELPMTAAEREAAEASLRQGAFIAGLLLRVVTIVRSAAACIGHVFRWLARPRLTRARPRRPAPMQSDVKRVRHESR